MLLEEQQCEGKGPTILLGDLSKGGRPPTLEEQEQLAGTHADGIPKGLLPCLWCGSGGASASTPSATTSS